MGKHIFVTGISGSGKSSVSKVLNDKGYIAHDLDDIPGLFTMIDKRTGNPFIDQDNDDLEKVKNMAWVCDVENLKNIVEDEKSDISFYCGNAENIDEIIPIFGLVILLKVNPDVARHRLTIRESNDFAKRKEIQDWLLTCKDEWEDNIERKGAMVINAGKDINNVTEEIIQIAKSSTRI